jgi:class 3 adenylate cyclase/predicted ATPase
MTHANDIVSQQPKAPHYIGDVGANELRRTVMSFVFTDIEGSTRRWESHPDEMMNAVARHDELLEAAMSHHGGEVFHHSGDGVIASFCSPLAAINAAADAQARLDAEDWAQVDGMNVRMAVHVGDVVMRDGELFGWALNFGSRLNAIGHGGQVLLSESCVESIVSDLVQPLDLVELGLTRLRDIAQPTRVFQLVGPSLRRDFPPLRNTVTVNQLPLPRQSIVGRDAEVEAVARDLGVNRVVSLIGARGVGTSRLALAAGHHVAAQYGDGVLHCDLGGVNPSGVADAVATSFGIGPRSGLSIEKSVVEWLGTQDLLLVFEHCEHAIEAVDRLLSGILAGAPNATVLCTSERPVGIAGELIYRVAPLSSTSSVALFIERATAAGAMVADSPAIRDLCEHLEGMPLAIEVAAANAPIYTVRELSERLRRRELPARSGTQGDPRSMNEAVALGFDALPEGLRHVLSAAAIFAGSFDRADFAAVCMPTATPNEADEAITALLNRSLIQLRHVDGQPLFRLLAVVSEYARVRATSESNAAAASRFVDHMIELSTTAANDLRGPEEGLACRRVGEQFDNIRAAFERSLASGDFANAATLSTVLWEYGFMRLHSEYSRWSLRVIDTFAAGDEAGLAPVLGVAAIGAWFRDDLQSSMELARRAIRLETEFELDFDLPARLALQNATVYSGAGSAPPDILAEMASYQRSRPELYFHVNVDTQNSIMSTWLGDTEAATRRAIRAVRLARESKNPSSLAFALWALGSALETEDEPQAETLLGNALDVAREVDNGWLTAIVQMSLASLRRRSSSPIDAVPILIDLLDLLWRAGHRSHLWATLRLCGLVLGDLGEDALAVQTRSWVSSAQSAMPPLPVDAAAIEAQSQQLVDEHGEAWVDRQSALVASWTTESAVATVRSALQQQLA